MERRLLILDGEKFSDLDGFYREIGRLLGGDGEEGHNLGALTDLLYGGFGVHAPGEPIRLIWKKARKSRRELGYAAAAREYRRRLERAHPSNRDSLEKRLADAERGVGPTLFDELVGVIGDCAAEYDCELVLE